MSPSLEIRQKLLAAGKDTHDPLDVMNAFYTMPVEASCDVFSEYWATMVAVLCERLVKAEKNASAKN